MSSEAFVTVLPNDHALAGALVLGKSLRLTNTSKVLCALVSRDVTTTARNYLRNIFDLVREIDYDVRCNEIQCRPDLTYYFQKVSCWKLCDFSKCVFIEADCMVMQNVDDLFLRRELSAAPDIMWPDHFNTGVMVLEPSQKTYEDLINHGLTGNFGDSSDYFIFNAYYDKWSTEDISKHLPFIYNVTPTAFYSYQPALCRFKEDVKIFHFSGYPKPWQKPMNEDGGASPGQSHYYEMWWGIFNNHIRALFGDTVTSYIGKTSTADSNDEIGTVAHRQAWERGEIDFLGRDSFENIKAFLNQVIEKEIIE